MEIASNVIQPKAAIEWAFGRRQSINKEPYI